MHQDASWWRVEEFLCSKTMHQDARCIYSKTRLGASGEASRWTRRFAGPSSGRPSGSILSASWCKSGSTRLGVHQDGTPRWVQIWHIWEYTPRRKLHQDYSKTPPRLHPDLQWKSHVVRYDTATRSSVYLHALKLKLRVPLQMSAPVLVHPPAVGGGKFQDFDELKRKFSWSHTRKIRTRGQREDMLARDTLHTHTVSDDDILCIQYAYAAE